MSGARRLVVLSSESLDRLRRAADMGITQRKLAERFGVSTQTIRRILRRPRPADRPVEAHQTA